MSLTPEDYALARRELVTGRNTAEVRTLAVLREYTSPDEGGFMVYDDTNVSARTGLSHQQFMAALSRLAAKGLVEAVRWEAGPGGRAVWVWFPKRTHHWNPPRDVNTL